MTSVDPHEALARLRAGNERFVLGRADAANVEPRADASEHRPFAAVLGCSDARVTPEIVFDQGAGELFVVRVAGNVAAPEQIESLEFAVAGLGARLVVVLGHSRCGAVAATLEMLRTPGAPAPLPAITARIRPAVEEALGTRPSSDDASALEAVRANVRASVAEVMRSPVITGEIDRSGLRVVGAVYSVEERSVEFDDDN